MTAGVCCSLIAALWCLSVYLSTTDAEGAATVSLNGPINLVTGWLPEPEKPGVCPRNNVEEALLGVCAEMCSHDSDCPDDQKCCSNGCGHQCMPPYKEKHGSCPKIIGEGLCVEMCSHDSDCPNNQKCCSNGCGHQCMAP
ncbi:WAP four-disulfide core domain protein 2-like isoform X2 [Sinocyclocheilus grahami]|uniref:WAP four-disulfide core domain protein 2-like isoform X2 n=1 Tax=Sinocyclocheilus grahami TaxID=75366 RepID=UPI0007AD0B6A|nr:PREDICTED: WAP four-disulfide core domain protein 2-like isoform X2 [Sinocyclocheilus grahami]